MKKKNRVFCGHAILQLEKKKIYFFLYLDNLYTNGKNLNEIICDIKGHIIRN